MRVILFLVVLVIVAASVYGDYRWKRWMTRQREERERPDSTPRE
jgi:nicotinamide riboside transporter PnuC